ncbi:DUF6191 domain-containing protein [Amycolatopsis alkalitolerans]|uniref:Uncharacterized protein n=1 Tax=Amycolatopsis alkalitolerans TaxID=2547244 RepID=A0A5C4M881_9PSEU|nr:DUF6191 domain-containing protein [Amycolatopsis alkalitolerans]TNC27416.1 hypothetical protein FG385_10120 [Amycolatopsis alkalitolerans]
MGVVWALSIPGLVVGLFVLALLESAGARLNWLPWRRRSTRSAAGLANEELFSFLYGTKRVELEQRDIELVLPQREEDGAPPRSSVDLEAGVAFLEPPHRA